MHAALGAHAVGVTVEVVMVVVAGAVVVVAGVVVVVVVAGVVTVVVSGVVTVVVSEVVVLTCAETRPVMKRAARIVVIFLFIIVMLNVDPKSKPLLSRRQVS